MVDALVTHPPPQPGPRPQSQPVERRSARSGHRTMTGLLAVTTACPPAAAKARPATRPAPAITTGRAPLGIARAHAGRRAPASLLEQHERDGTVARGELAVREPDLGFEASVFAARFC